MVSEAGNVITNPEVSVLFVTSENTNFWKTVHIRSEEKGIAFLVSGGVH